VARENREAERNGFVTTVVLSRGSAETMKIADAMKAEKRSAPPAMDWLAAAY
jgi:hypothetical protein